MSPLITELARPASSQPDIIDGLIPRHAGNGSPKIFAEDQYEIPEKKRKGTYYRRTTNWIDVLDDKLTLEEWKCRMTADGFLRHAPELAADFLALADPFDADRVEANKIVKAARTAADKARKADLGNALHDIYERITTGQPAGFIPEEFRKDVAAFEKCLADAGLRVIHAEVFGVNDEWQMAGTLDQLLEEVATGEVFVGDIKTGRMDYAMGKTTRQVAAYAGYRRYDPVTFKRSPLLADGREIRQDIGFLVSSPAGSGSCVIRKLDLERGRQDLALAQQVHEYRSLWNRKAMKEPEIVSRVDL